MEVFARLRLLASAVAGRAVEVSPIDGERSYTDGRTIFVAVRTASDVERAVVVQAALIGAGSLDPAVLKKLTGHRRVFPRYLTLEVARAADLLSGVLPPRVGTAVRAVVDQPWPASADESRAWAADRGHPIADAPDWFGELRPAKVRRALGEVGAGRRPPGLESASVQTDLADLDDDKAETSRVLELFQMPGRSPLSSVLQKLLGMGRSSLVDGAGGGDTSSGQMRADATSGAHARELAAVLPAALSAPVARPGRRYPEWDENRAVLRPNWCAVTEFDPPYSEVPALWASAPDRVLCRQLAALGFGAVHRRGQLEGDVLDLDALVDFVADRASGEVHEARVYAQSRRTARDLGVLVLLDATASSADAVAGERQFDEHRRIVDRLTEALGTLADPVAAYGFASSGREAVRFLRIKDFRDSYDQAARERLARVGPSGFTRLGAVIRHATHLLERDAGTARRLLVMVGDGFPYEMDYEGEYAEADTRHALDAAVAKGIGCVRISVDGGIAEQPGVTRVWQHVPHRQLVAAEELAAHVRPLFTRAVRVASASKRSTADKAAVSTSTPQRPPLRGVSA